ncbi:alpha/beta fold hydrolase [Pasteurellaceae bacterium 22721_9_1]
MQRESQFHHFLQQQLSPWLAPFPVQYIEGKKGCRLAYRHFLQTNGSDKLMILVNGRAENLLKWSEVAYDFYHQGYDVLLFDHRGQGYSQRLLPHTEKGYIDEFRFYAEDMAKIIENITALYTYQTQHLLAHSLGALISSFYLANADHQIKSAVFSAPFFALPMKNLLMDEILLSLMMLFGQGKKYVFGKTDYQPVDVMDNKLSSSQVRMQWMNEINLTFPEVHLGGPTFKWAHLCLQATKKLPTILSRIEIPVLILQAEQEQIVSNKTLQKLTALLPQGKLIKVAQAKHEILFERDEIRQQAFAEIKAFLTR